MTTPQSTSPTLSVEASETSVSSNRIFTPEQVQANLAQYEAQYLDLFATLDQMGLREGPYTSPFSGTVSDESFANARLQSGMVALISEKIADALLVKGIIQGKEKDSIIRSAVLHNSLKRLEVLGKTEGLGVQAYSEAWYDVLRTTINERNVTVGESDIEVASMMRKVIGHGSLKNFVAIDKGLVTLNGDRSLAEMIVHIASDMVGAKNPKYDGYTPNIQISNFVDRATFADFARAYPFLWKEGFSLSDGGTQEFFDIAHVNQSADGVQAKSYYDWQAMVYEMICKHIQRQVAPHNRQDPIGFIVGLVTSSEGGGDSIIQAGSMITSAVNDITDPNNPNRLKDLRQIMISASDALLRANPGKYIFTTQEITENPDLHKFRAAHDALISASELQEVSRDDRRVIFEANNVSEGFSIKKYEVFQESRVLGKGLGDHYHTFTRSDDSQFAEAFCIGEGSGQLVIQTIDGTESTVTEFKKGDIILLPRRLAHTLWFEGELQDGVVARFTGFLPRSFDPDNMDLNAYRLPSPYQT